MKCICSTLPCKHQWCCSKWAHAALVLLREPGSQTCILQSLSGLWALLQVPAYFDPMQREATIAAGKLAGLDKVRLIRCVQ